jgi:hypothetical protein
MSRHGYSEDCDDELALGRWRGRIASATRGKRGQAFFRALVDALDAMPEKRLAARALETSDGEVCALGCLGRARGLDLSSIDTYDDEKLGGLFDIAPCLTQEVMYMNDEAFYGAQTTPENRWQIVRDWAARQIKPVDEVPSEAK